MCAKTPNLEFNIFFFLLFSLSPVLHFHLFVYVDHFFDAYYIDVCHEFYSKNVFVIIYWEFDVFHSDIISSLKKLIVFNPSVSPSVYQNQQHTPLYMQKILCIEFFCSHFRLDYLITHCQVDMVFFDDDLTSWHLRDMHAINLLLVLRGESMIINLKLKYFLCCFHYYIFLT